MPKIGNVVRVNLPGDVTRRAEIMRYDADDEMVLVRWVGYDLPNEWIPTRHL